MKIIYLFFILSLLISCNANDNNEEQENKIIEQVSDGERLFKNQCASCHKPDKDFTGPALKGSLQRWGNDKKAMYSFIRNPPLSAQTNKYAKTLVKKWKSMMTAFVLSDHELDAIMNYCSNYMPHIIVDSVVVSKY